MLYDPKWDKTETKADPFSLESLIAWLEKQPADQQYEFCEYNNCLLAQWLQSIDPKAQVTPEDGFTYRALGTRVDLWGDTFPKIAHAGDTHARHRHTFGAALERARAAQSPANAA
jgi:hypothetical protein